MLILKKLKNWTFLKIEKSQKIDFFSFSDFYISIITDFWGFWRVCVPQKALAHLCLTFDRLRPKTTRTPHVTYINLTISKSFRVIHRHVEKPQWYQGAECCVKLVILYYSSTPMSCFHSAYILPKIMPSWLLIGDPSNSSNSLFDNVLVTCSLYSFSQFGILSM